MKYQSPRVRVGLARLGWTQTDLARELEISSTYLIDILAGRRQSKKLQREIAFLLKVRFRDVVHKKEGEDDGE